VGADLPQREAGAPRTRTNRREDIPLLIDHFTDRFNRLQEKNIAAVSDDVLALLMSHDFPGNARELENIIEHGFVLCRGGLIELEHLPPELTCGGKGVEMPRRTGATLRSLEECHIVDALRRHRGNRKAAAAELGIHPSTLFRKIRDLGIEVPEFDGRHRAD
jgi:DNA-binding NtrC family response regulator